jgi:hypothetical protein
VCFRGAFVLTGRDEQRLIIRRRQELAAGIQRGANVQLRTIGSRQMAWGFEIGRIYNRRIDIHARFGGQQQRGIITPSAQHPARVRL